MLLNNVTGKLKDHVNYVHTEVNKEVTPDITDEEATIIVTRASEPTSQNQPIVLLFGWAGANHKNLGKYSTIYEEAGFTTIKYILSTRHIFRDTHQVPELMGKLIEQIGKGDLVGRPLYIHCLSDTGTMCYQGFNIANRKSNIIKSLAIEGIIWDSCPGPYPEVTLSRVIAFLIVNWVCCMRDKLGMMQSIYNSYRLLLDRGWPNLLRRWQGKPVNLNLMDGQFCGHFARDHYRHSPVPELFLYSDKDFYLPHTYLEQEVLAPRQKVGTNFTAVKFHGSSHVAHLKHHKKQYKKEVIAFVSRTNVNIESEEHIKMDTNDATPNIMHVSK